MKDGTRLAGMGGLKTVGVSLRDSEGGGVHRMDGMRAGEVDLRAVVVCLRARGSMLEGWQSRGMHKTDSTRAGEVGLSRVAHRYGTGW